MNTHDAPSPLDQYPGYFPPRRATFWTRTKVGVVTSVAGIGLGFAATGGAAIVDDQPASAAETSAISKSDVRSAVADATAQLERKLKAERAEAKRAARAQRAALDEAVTEAVDRAREEERARARKQDAQGRTTTVARDSRS